MRVYLPATSASLSKMIAAGRIGPAPLTAFAVTPGLREWYVDDDIEELEYAALLEAARASLRMLGSNSELAARRIVIAADVDDAQIAVRDDLDRGVVAIAQEIPISACASVHMDDADAETTIAAAAPFVDAADLGDPAAEAAVDDADGFELSWYATQELGAVLDELNEGSG